MPGQEDVFRLAEGLFLAPFIDGLALLNFMPDGHLIEIAVAFTAAVEIKANTGKAGLHTFAGKQLVQPHHAHLIHRKPVEENHRRERAFAFRRAQASAYQPPVHV